MPLARNPVYCATKAAVRSFTQTLRYQLRKTNVRVVELQPPAVQTDLHDYMGAHGKQVTTLYVISWLSAQVWCHHECAAKALLQWPTIGKDRRLLICRHPKA